MMNNTLLFTWEDTQQDFGVRLLYDQLIWAATPKDDPRGGGEIRQPLDEFVRDGVPMPFTPPRQVDHDLRELIISGAWRQIEQWEYGEVLVDRRQKQTTVQRRGADLSIERYQGADEPMIARLLDQLSGEGWSFVRTVDDGHRLMRHDFTRRWQP